MVASSLRSRVRSAFSVSACQLTNRYSPSPRTGTRRRMIGRRRTLKRANMTALLCWSALLVVASISAAARLSAQSAVSEELRQRLEQMRESGKLVAAGLTISGQSPLVTVYEQAGFIPLWNTNTANELVRALRAVAADGLDP